MGFITLQSHHRPVTILSYGASAATAAVDAGFPENTELSIDAEGDVWSGGRAVAVVTGTLDWPE